MTTVETRKKNLGKRILQNKWVYLFLLPGIAYLILFSYVPMYGLTLAFKDFKISAGIFGSPWSDPLYKNFAKMFDQPDFWRAFFNTFRMGFWYILTGFPMPIILAMLLNELKANRYKKVLQTVYTFPNFLSWVIIGGLMTTLFASDGFVNMIIRMCGGETYNFLTDTDLIRPLLYASNVWKGAGWSAIMYLAAMSGISPELYEAAEVDGANRFHKMLYITWPGIKPTAVILLILAFGGIMNNGFDQILNMVNPVVQDAAENIDTYIYRKTFQDKPDYGFSTAMGLSKSVINFVFLLAANKIAKLLGEGGVM
ncbi:MAG TPA: sugar ABC transporter permease [Candidatus Merdivicinus faecavium]|nr:sugar ABC transporter permease [Candidatus Merdivicinus faecavium]